MSNESALSFLMPSVAFLPTASRHNPASKTHRYFGLKKKKKKQPESTGDGWNPPGSPHRLLVHYTEANMTVGKVLSVPLVFPGTLGSIWIDTQRQCEGTGSR